MIMRSLIVFLFLLRAMVFAQPAANDVVRGNESFKQKRFAEAEKSYRKALQKDPNMKEAQFNLGDALFRQKKYADAAAAFQGLQGAAAKDLQAESYHNLGNIAMQEKKYEDAVKAYVEALRRKPQDKDTQYNLNYALSKLRRQQQKQKQQQQKQQKGGSSNQQKPQPTGGKKDQPKPSANPNQMDRKQAEQMLKALENSEKAIQRRKGKRFKGDRSKPEKDW